MVVAMVVGMDTKTIIPNSKLILSTTKYILSNN